MKKWTRNVLLLCFMILALTAFGIMANAETEEIDFNTIDWSTVRLSDLDESKLDWMADWIHWMETEAAAEQLMEVEQAVDGAYATAYGCALGKRFLQEPYELISALALVEEADQQQIIRFFVSNDYYSENSIDILAFLAEVKLPDDATGAIRDVLDTIITQAENYYSTNNPMTGDPILVAVVMLCFSGTGLAVLVKVKKSLL